MKKRALHWLFLWVVLTMALPSLWAQSDSSIAENALRVVEVVPNNGATVALTNDIVVIFNRPVVPLGTSLDSDQLPSPLEITPAVAGRGEWLNTSIYIFTPTEGFAGGTTYTVRVPATLTAFDGTSLAEAFETTFRTQAPSVSEILPPPNETSVLLDASVQVRFDQPMNQASVEAGFQVVSTGDNQAVSGVFEWSDDGAGFRFTPNQRLTLATQYEASLTGAIGLGGGAELTGLKAWEFTTVPYPALSSTYPRDREQSASPYGITFYFNTVMNAQTLKERILIAPEPEIEPDYYWDEWNNSYSVSFYMYPSTDYTVTLLAGAEDIYGNAMAEETVTTFRTSGLSPDLSLRAPYDIGFYNASRKPTSVYLSHVNTSQIDLSLYQLPVDEVVRAMTGENYYNWVRNLSLPIEPLARWTIPNVAPLNAMRFELLDFPSVLLGGGMNCPTALPSRVKVGDVVSVVTEPDPLRVRSVPATGEIIALLYKGNRVTIQSAPQCVDGILWWEVPTGDGRRGWIAESVGDEYFIEVSEAAQVTEVTLPDEVNNSQGTLPVGLYYLSATAPEFSASSYGSVRHLMIVGNATLMMKQIIDGVVIWATDVQTGAVLPNMPITVYGRDGVLSAGTTNADGVLRLELPRANNLYEPRIAILDDGTYFGMGSSEWTSGLDGYNFGVNTTAYPDEFVAYLYTDRPIYRPGQPVYFKGIVRQKDDMTYTRLPDSVQSVTVVARDYNGNEVYTETLPLNAFGTFSGELEIGADATLGYYYLELDLTAYSPTERYYSSGVSFMVAEYRLPEFIISMTPDEPEVSQGDTMSVTLDAKYFFGGAVSNANVSYSARSEPYYFQYSGDGYYSFEDFDYDNWVSGTYRSVGEQESGETRTDANGIAVIQIPATLEDSTQSQRFTIEATVRDESDQTVSARADVIVHKSLVYAGVTPASYIGTANQPTAFNFIAVDWQSTPQANQALTARVVERRWSSVQEQDDAGRSTWTWEVEEIPVVEEVSLQTGADGKAMLEFVPPRAGIYKAYVTTRDRAGNVSIASNTLWVSGREYVSWRQQNSNRIDLIADKSNYQVGDVAEILITSPYQSPVEALVTLERGDVLLSQRITLESNSYVYRIAIDEQFVPNVFVSVFIVKGVDETTPVAGFRAGYIQLAVNTESKVIQVDVSADVERAQPQETVTYTLKTTDYQGNPIQAEVGVGVTDLASLSLLPPNTSPLLPYFYGDQPLSVYTSTALTINTDQITQEILDTLKGGGGGFLSEGLVQIRGEFVDTPFWNASVITDENGIATVDVRLPDNLTTWRLDARAITDSSDGNLRVGQTTFDLLSTKPLIVRPVTPRFFVVGDEVVLGAVVNNNTNTPQETIVTLNAEGLTVQDALSQTVTVPANGRERVSWRVTVDDVRRAVLTFRADSGQYSDGSISPVSLDDVGTLPVYRYDVEEIARTAGALLNSGSVTERVQLPEGVDVEKASVTVFVDHSLMGTALQALRALDQDPYNHLEWSVSKMRANLATYRLLNTATTLDETLKTDLERAINLVLQKLYAEQKSDGGWGWTYRDESDYMMTTYALLALTEATEQGFATSNFSLSQAQSFLRSRFVTPSLSVPTYQLNRQALALYVLARSGNPDIGRTATLFESYQRLSLYAQGFLAQAIALINPQDTQRLDTLVSAIISQAVTSASGVYWQESDRDYFNWNTDTRTTAILLEALLAIAPDNALLPNVVRHLMIQRKADRWETPQETAWALNALARWAEKTGELNADYAYTVTNNDALLLENSVTVETVLESQQVRLTTADAMQPVNDLTITRTGSENGALYYVAQLNANLPVSLVEPLNKGFFIDRRYTRLGDESQTPITEARVGEVIQVRLTMVLPNARYFVVVNDPLPAGAEAINPNLSTSAQIGTRPELTREEARRYGWGWWWFSLTEFRDSKVVLSASYLPAGTYEFVYTMRPSVAGVYNVIPPTAYETYFPEVYGRGAGSTFTVLPSQGE